jgi:hypothetical protein
MLRGTVVNGRLKDPADTDRLREILDRNLTRV